MSEDTKSLFERIGKAVVAGLAVFGLVIIIALVMKSGAGASKPDLPVLVQTRNALLGPGRVARLVNNSGAATLDVIATFKNPTSQEERRYNVTLSPGRFKEIGYHEGWIVHTGDQVTLYNAAYKPITYNLQ